MDVKWLLFWFTYQIAIASLDGVTLPFTDFVGKVTPIKPKPLSTCSSPITKPLLRTGEDVMPKLFSPIAGGSVSREFSSPLCLTSSSRTLNVPKIESSSLPDVRIPDSLKNRVLSRPQTLPVIPRCNVPIKNTCPDVYLPDMLSSLPLPYVSSSRLSNSLPYSLPEISSCNKLLSLPRVSSLPTVPLEPLQRSGFDFVSFPSAINSCTTQPSGSSLSRLTPKASFESKTSSELFASNTLSPCSSYSMPYPLYYKSMNLPGVRTPAELLSTNCRPNPYVGPGSFNSLYQSACQSLGSSCSPSPMLSSKPLCPPKITSEFVPPFNRYCSSTLPMVPTSPCSFPKPCNIKPNYIDFCDLHYANNFGYFDNFNIPSILPILDTCVETVDRIQPDDLFRNFYQGIDFEDVRLLPEKYVTLSPPLIPTEPMSVINCGTSSYCPSGISYVNVSPSSPISQCSSNMVSSINNIVSNIVQNILSTYTSNLNSASQNTCVKLPISKMLEEPCAKVSSVNIESILPAINLPTTTVTFPCVDTPTVLSFDMSTPSVFDTPIPITSSLSVLSSPFILPSSTICPSFLPSPRLPSCPTISSPFCMEAPVYKVSSKKDRNLEKLVELVLLAEILNNDESFDWDDLDTLLALLSVS